MFLYTDGITEAMDPAGKLYGADRLISCLTHAQSPLIPAIEANVKEFIADAVQTDDITMITLEIKKK